MNKQEYDRLRYLSKKEEIKEKALSYYYSIGKEKRKDNEAFKKYQREYKKERFNNDPLFKLKANLRRAIAMAFNGKRKSQKAVELLGCTFEEAKKHLESQFLDGMSWENYGMWHIDHKSPLSLAKTAKELEKLWHFTNLQPLWAKDNLKKGNKLDWSTNL